MKTFRALALGVAVASMTTLGAFAANSNQAIHNGQPYPVYSSSQSAQGQQHQNMVAKNTQENHKMDKKKDVDKTKHHKKEVKNTNKKADMTHKKGEMKNPENQPMAEHQEHKMGQ